MMYSYEQLSLAVDVMEDHKAYDEATRHLAANLLRKFIKRTAQREAFVNELNKKFKL